MNCQEVQQWISHSRAFAADQVESLSPELITHLESCAACKQLHQQEIRFDQAVHAAMHEVTVPMDAEKVMQWRLRQARRQRQRTRVLHWTLAAAAVFALVVSLVWYLQRPYDLARLHEAIQSIETRRPVATYVISQARQQGDLQQWLKRQGVATAIPSRLKLQYLTAAYIVEIGGRKVAVLELAAGSSTSKVCLLQRRYFNETLQQRWQEQAVLSSVVISDHEQSESLGWMIVDQGSAHLFVEGLVPQNGV